MKKLVVRFSSFTITIGKTELTDDIISNAEKFLLKCISDQNLNKFDDIMYEQHRKKLHLFDLEKFPPTSSSIRQQILSAYSQCHLWLHAPFIEDIFWDPLGYGYMVNEEDYLAPIIKLHLAFPLEFSSPCNCLKCARAQIFHAKSKRVTVVDFATVRQLPLT